MSHLKIWEAPEGAIGRDDFKVSVRIPGGIWQPLFVYEVKVDMHNVRQASMAYLDMEGYGGGQGREPEGTCSSNRHPPPLEANSIRSGRSGCYLPFE